MLLVRPQSTLSVSVTGSSCVLSCKHCNRHYLKNMADPSMMNSAASRGTKSFLISGGLGEGLFVPWERHKEELELLRRQYNVRFNIHTGPRISDSSIEILKDLVDVVSFDVIGNQRTMKEVYGVDAWRDSVRTLEMLIKADIKVIPHVTIGLEAGLMTHEFEAVSTISDLGLDCVVFLVLIPTPQTPYAHSPLPEIERVRNLFSSVEIRKVLGCMVPHGNYRKELQKAAVDTGFTAIVKPVSETIRKIELENRDEIEYGDECCAFYF